MATERLKPGIGVNGEPESRCRSCDAALKTGAQFCHRCGGPVALPKDASRSQRASVRSASSRDASQPERVSKRTIYIVIGWVLTGVAVAIGLLMAQRQAEITSAVNYYGYENATAQGLRNTAEAVEGFAFMVGLIGVVTLACGYLQHPGSNPRSDDDANAPATPVAASGVQATTERRPVEDQNSVAPAVSARDVVVPRHIEVSDARVVDKRPWASRYRALMVVFAIPVVLGAAQYAFPLAPDVTGKTASDAGAVVESIGLRVDAPGYTNERVDDTGVGLVSSQTPVPGTPMWRWKTLHIVLAGFKPVAVPKLPGDTSDRANKLLQAAGLKVGSRTERRSAGYPSGWVLECSPAAGELVQPGSSVDLVVVQEPDVTVPGVLGMDAAKAKALLTDRGLKVTFDCGEGKFSPLDSVGPGLRVISQAPQSWTWLRPGSTVYLTVSQRPKATLSPAIARKGEHFFAVASGMGYWRGAPGTDPVSVFMVFGTDSFQVDGVPRSTRDGDVLELEMGQSTPDEHEASYVSTWR